MNNLTQEEIELLRYPSLEGLAFALRNLERVLPKFQWNFGELDCCGIGVAKKLWNIHHDLNELRITDKQYDKIFYQGHEKLKHRIMRKIFGDDFVDNLQEKYSSKTLLNTTPEFVAKQIEKIYKKNPELYKPYITLIREEYQNKKET
jgi:hypothetical protein